MTDNDMDSGFELVLDNRRLIAAFAIFALICGSFFVIGYTTGKRQGEISASGSGILEAPAAATVAGGASSDVPPVKEDELRQDLEWYESVSSGEAETAGTAFPRISENAATKPAPAKPAPAKPAPASAGIVYSVQVGAFSTRERAETHSADLRSKGFDSRIEAQADSGGLFLVRVGRFNTKPEATQMQLQLKKNGFDAQIKTN